MGNAVSAASQIVNSHIASTENTFPANNLSPIGENVGKPSSVEIPPECPMHKSRSESGCPVKHGRDDVNPLNMVSLYNGSELKYLPI